MAVNLVAATPSAGSVNKKTANAEILIAYRYSSATDGSIPAYLNCTANLYDKSGNANANLDKVMVISIFLSLSNNFESFLKIAQIAPGAFFLIVSILLPLNIPS